MRIRQAPSADRRAPTGSTEPGPLRSRPYPDVADDGIIRSGAPMNSAGTQPAGEFPDRVSIRLNADGGRNDRLRRRLLVADRHRDRRARLVDELDLDRVDIRGPEVFSSGWNDLGVNLRLAFVVGCECSAHRNSVHSSPIMARWLALPLWLRAIRRGPPAVTPEVETASAFCLAWCQNFSSSPRSTSGNLLRSQ